MKLRHVQPAPRLAGMLNQKQQYGSFAHHSFAVMLPKRLVKPVAQGGIC